VIGIPLQTTRPTRLFVAVTDNNWFSLLASRRGTDEVNFWRPSSQQPFKRSTRAKLLLFKLHAPDNFIAGGGFFTRFLQLPLSMAWDAFGEANGVRTLPEMRERISLYRRTAIAQFENPSIGCIMHGECFFWDRSMWFQSPEDFKLNTVVGKGCSSETDGRGLWEAVSERLQLAAASVPDAYLATVAALESHGFGKPQVVHPRLGQGSFRVLVTDVYERRCSMTGERTLPVLEAAHIKPYSLVQRHEVSNGLLLRSDLHKQFDEGYPVRDSRREGAGVVRNRRTHRRAD
jgi:putative restriction endonuclease